MKNLSTKIIVSSDFFSVFRKTFDGVFHRRHNRSFPARLRFKRKRSENVNIRGKKGGTAKSCPSSRRIMLSGNERRATLLRSLPLGRRKSFCEIFLYPTQVTLSVSKKKLRYTTCKCILNVTVNCPYSKAPPTHAICREKKLRVWGRDREREKKMHVRWNDWLCELIIWQCVHVYVGVWRHVRSR